MLRTTSLCIGVSLATVAPQLAFADFVDDAKYEIALRNFYFDRNYQNPGEVFPAQRDWAQGIIFKADSGYTEGPVGFGLNVVAMEGFNLLGADASNYARSGLLPVKDNNSRASNYGKVGLTGKMKYSKTELKVGELVPQLPTIFASPARLFMQAYRGVHLKSNEIDGLELEGFYVDKVRQRDSIHYTAVGTDNVNHRFKTAATADDFYTVGGSYQLNSAYNIRAYHAELNGIYQQQFLGFTGKQPLNKNLNLLSDVRFFNSYDTGAKKIGEIDNRHLSALVGLNKNNQTLSIGYMQSFGDTGLIFLSGTESPVVLDFMSSDFSNHGERVYAIRYDYDFKDVMLGDYSLNGFKAMVRYGKGEHVNLNQYGKGFEEKSTELDLSYRIPEGKLKGLGVRTRFARYRNNFPSNMTFRSQDETRLYVEYARKF
ncbi:OprD family outer membrane porin [Acinetobacter sp.]|uniref:OprD family outer membrane porin n=1 Tax=Acinetobacter sp. TaxID=472 RepID=UPI0031D66531